MLTFQQGLDLDLLETICKKPACSEAEGFFQLIKTEFKQHLHISTLQDNKLVGVVAFKKIWAHHYYIMYLAIVDNYQGRGIGTALLKEVAKEAQKTHIDVLELQPTSGAKGFYQKLGFQPSGTWQIKVRKMLKVQRRQKAKRG